MKRTIPLVTAAAAAAAAAFAVPALTTAQAPPGRTITVQEKVERAVTDDVAPKAKRGAVSLGDRLVARQTLSDTSGKRLGTLFTACTGVGPTKPFEEATLLCDATYRLADGEIVAAGSLVLGGMFELAITGGTGAYANARGVVKSVTPAAGFDSADAISLTAP